MACALAIQDAVTREGSAHPAQAPRVRVGVHAGEVAETAGDLFGNAVNAAARICVEAAARETSPDDFGHSLGDAAPELARVVPQLRTLLPDIPPPLELPPEQQRRHMFSSLGDFIARVAASQPRLHVLEDLHWADESTLLAGYLLTRGGRDDRARASTLLGEAAAGYRRIGMPRHLAMVEDLLAAAPAG